MYPCSHQVLLLYILKSQQFTKIRSQPSENIHLLIYLYAFKASTSLYPAKNLLEMWRERLCLSFCTFSCLRKHLTNYWNVRKPCMVCSVFQNKMRKLIIRCIFLVLKLNFKNNICKNKKDHFLHFNW